VNYEDWLKNVPSDITEDALWTVKAYRYALFLSDLCWYDVTKLTQDKRTLDLSDQLYRAAGSISANIAEGYSRGTGKDRARFYEYALGSARESRDWYYKARHILGESVTQHRSGLLTEVIRLLITMVPQQRQGGTIREEHFEYDIDPAFLLNDVPMP
jgi:four helix bundle protein